MLAFEELKDEMAEKMEEMEDRIMDEHEHQLEQVKKEYKKLIRDLEDRLTKRYDKKISEEAKKRELADKELQEDIEGVGYRLKKVKRTVNDEELRYKRSLASKNLAERYDELEKLRELPTFTPTSVINNVQIARNARSFKLDLYQQKSKDPSNENELITEQSTPLMSKIRPLTHYSSTTHAERAIASKTRQNEVVPQQQTA